METYENPQKCHCYTCKHFQADVAYSNGKPCRFVGNCLHPKRLGFRRDADDQCPDHNFADWTKAEVLAGGRNMIVLSVFPDTTTLRKFCKLMKSSATFIIRRLNNEKTPHLPALRG